ncbi:MAG: response regulator [Oceanobacter sp.]
MTLHWIFWLATLGWLLMVIFWLLRRNSSLANDCCQLELVNKEHLARLEHLPFNLLELDASGQVVACNLYSIGIDLETSIPLDEQLSGNSRSEFAGLLASARSSNMPVTIKLVFRGYELRTFLGQLVELPERSGRTSTLIGFVETTSYEEERTDLKSERDKALRASDAKSRFLANMSHEIRTPMTGLLGMVSLMEQTRLSDEQRGFQNIIQSSSEHLLAIVNDILDISKIDAGKLTIEQEAFDLHELISSLLDMVGNKAQEKNLVLQSFVDESLPPLFLGDPIRIRQVLINFLNNALKFTHQGHVLLRVVRVNNNKSTMGLRFSVEDSGVGISANALSNLFEEYTLAHGRMSENAGGTGLGLSICQRLAKLMGGRVGVLSTPGVGSNFWFDINLSVASTELIEPDTSAASSDLEIWICEAQQVYRTLVVSVGRQAHMTPKILSTQEGLLALIEDGKAADLVVMSAAYWSRLDGRIQDWIDRHQPRLVVSGVDNLADDGQELLKRGACGYWEWPISQANLADLFNRVMKQSAPFTQLVTRFNRYQTSFGDETGKDMFSGVAVLLVEDNKVNQKVARQLLNKLGCQVTIADNGKIAVDLSAEKSFDLILMDCHMPVMDGLDACRHIRSREASHKLPHTPIVALTADVMEEIRHACAEAGMDGYLCKPIRLEELRKELPTYLNPATIQGLSAS